MPAPAIVDRRLTPKCPNTATVFSSGLGASNTGPLGLCTCGVDGALALGKLPLPPRPAGPKSGVFAAPDSDSAAFSRPDRCCWRRASLSAFARFLSSALVSFLASGAGLEMPAGAGDAAADDDAACWLGWTAGDGVADTTATDGEGACGVEDFESMVCATLSISLNLMRDPSEQCIAVSDCSCDCIACDMEYCAGFVVCGWDIVCGGFTKWWRLDQI